MTNISRNILCAAACFMLLLAQEQPAVAQSNNFRLMFYNLENYFDTKDDPATNDNDFTPTGSYHWSWQRFIDKRNAIYKVIVAVNEERIPDVIGLCELENRYVLHHLTQLTPFSQYEYEIVHRDSPDERGIDVALLYRKASFEVLNIRYKAIDTEELRFKSREILYVKGVAHGTDTLHIFVNHWPSKRGSAERSEPRRMAAAFALRTLVDSIQGQQANAAICIMGDFNDYADSRPMLKGLKVATITGPIQCKQLYNLAIPLAKEGKGSLKYKNRWELIDQFIVSGSLINNEKGLHCEPKGMEILSCPFMLEPSSGNGYSPKRTYKGMRYNGGFSDHLPIGLTLYDGVMQ